MPVLRLGETANSTARDRAVVEKPTVMTTMPAIVARRTSI